MTLSTSAPGHLDRADAFRWKFVAPLFLGSALNPINSSVIATALVPIAVAMHVSVGRTALLVSALYLASAIAQPTAGKLSEVFGPRRVFLAGIVIVLAGGVLGGLSQDLAMLVVARVLIGVGTSAGYPSAMLLIRRRAAWAGLDAPPGGVLGGLAIAGLSTIAVGPPVGGLLVGALGWRSAFLINIPITLVALAMAAYWIPRDRPVDGSDAGTRCGVPHRRGRHRGLRRRDDRPADLPDVAAAPGLPRAGRGGRGRRRAGRLGAARGDSVLRRAPADR